MAETLADVKYQVAVANRVLWALGLASGVTASLGHASLRVPGRPDRFVVGSCVATVRAVISCPHD